MAFSKSFKLVGGTVGLSMTLGVPAAIASQADSGDGDIVLDDVVAVTDIGSTLFALNGPFVLGDDDDSLASPFDSVASVDSPDSPDSPDGVDSPDSSDSA